MTVFKTKAARIAGYACFGVFSFLVSLYLTFPSKAVGQRVSYEIERASAGALTVDLASPSLLFPFGISARNVRVKVSQAEGDDIQFVLDKASGGVDFWSLLSFSLRPRGTVRVGDGVISGAYSDGDVKYVDATISELDLLRPPIIPSVAGLTLNGVVTGSTTLALDADPKKSSGSLELILDDAGLGPGKVAGFSLPEKLGLGRIELKLAVKDGEMVVEKYTQSPDAQVLLDLSGKMTLKKRFLASSMDSCLRFKMNDEELLKRLPKLETAIQLAGARFKADPDGFLNVPLRGALTRPQRGTGIRAGKGLCPSGDSSRAAKR